jgi:hypothetical protein
MNSTCDESAFYNSKDKHSLSAKTLTYTPVKAPPPPKKKSLAKPKNRQKDHKLFNCDSLETKIKSIFCFLL